MGENAEDGLQRLAVALQQQGPGRDHGEVETPMKPRIVLNAVFNGKDFEVLA